MTAVSGTSPALAGSFSSENPARPTDVVGNFRASTTGDVSTAIDAAVDAQAAWAARSASERATVVGGIAHALARELHALSDLIMREVGKPRNAAEDEVRKAAEQFHFASQLAYQSEGATFPAESAETFAHTLREPLGVICAITPWNFPVSLPARKLAPALSVGNAVVFKPSPVAAATGDLLAELCMQAGLPAGLLQVVHGNDELAMKELLGREEVAAVTFTGSDAVGEVVRRETHSHARMQAELGGHNGVLVCADADLRVAAREITAGAFALTGQACTASARILVERPVLESLAELVSSEVQRITVGPGDRVGVTCGPVATKAQLNRLTALRTTACAAGTLLAEGRLLEDVDPEGYWVLPAALVDVPVDHAVHTSEVFGPLLSLVAVDDADDAIDLLNASRHGLVAAVHTSNLTTAIRFTRAVRCGIVKVNQRTTGNGIAPPFGGWKASRVGTLPEGGRHAVDFFTDSKTVYLRY